MAPTPTPHNPNPNVPENKTQRHVEIRPMSTKEIETAVAGGNIVMILPACACEVKIEVFGHLIIV